MAALLGGHGLALNAFAKLLFILRRGGGGVNLFFLGNPSPVQFPSFLVLILGIQAGQQPPATAIYTPLSGPPHKPHPSTCRHCPSGHHETGVSCQWMLFRGVGYSMWHGPGRGTHPPTLWLLVCLPPSPVFQACLCLLPPLLYCPVHCLQALLLFFF